MREQLLKQAHEQDAAEIPPPAPESTDPADQTEPPKPTSAFHFFIRDVGKRMTEMVEMYVWILPLKVAH